MPGWAPSRPRPPQLPRIAWATYIKNRGAPRSQGVHERAVAARAGVRLFRRGGQPGAHHPARAPLSDTHAAADPDARRNPDRLQAPLVRVSVALAGAHRTLAATYRVRGRAVARSLSRLGAHPPVP